MKNTVLPLSAAMLCVALVLPIQAQDRGTTAKSKPATSTPAPPPTRRGTVSKRRIPPPPPRARGRIATSQKTSSARFGPDPTGRTDQAGKAVPFYPSVRVLGKRQDQKSAYQTPKPGKTAPDGPFHKPRGS
jgi:hypothetical protein